MFERVRSCGVSVYVAGQSDHSIAYRSLVQNADRILSAANTIILHASNNPDRIIGRAGTLDAVEEVSAVEGDEASGRGSVRLAEIPRIDANVIRQLTIGEVFVIAHGKAHHVRVAPVRIAETTMVDSQTRLPTPVSGDPAPPAATTEYAPSGPASLVEQGGRNEPDDDILT